jgi:hypothetical protein
VATSGDLERIAPVARVHATLEALIVSNQKVVHRIFVIFYFKKGKFNVK